MLRFKSMCAPAIEDLISPSPSPLLALPHHFVQNPQPVVGSSGFIPVGERESRTRARLAGRFHFSITQSAEGATQPRPDREVGVTDCLSLRFFVRVGADAVCAN